MIVWSSIAISLSVLLFVSRALLAALYCRLVAQLQGWLAVLARNRIECADRYNTSSKLYSYTEIENYTWPLLSPNNIKYNNKHAGEKNFIIIFKLLSTYYFYGVVWLCQVLQLQFFIILVHLHHLEDGALFCRFGLTS